MTLVQIGVTRQKTVLELIQELADRQSHEIAELKRSALARSSRKSTRVKKSHTRSSHTH